jgi:Fe(3+) dicitrate transport protein
MTSTSSHHTLAIAALVLLPVCVSASDDADQVEVIDTVTIIGTKADVADIPGSAHLIDAEELAEFSSSDILRVLRSVPGVYIQEEEGFGLRPNIGIRGSGLDRSARIALLEDGVLIAPAPYAASSAYYFPTQRRMSAVEVLKGPASVAVGPRTTGGAMNMISTPIPDEMGANADLRIGNYSTMDAHINVGDRGDRFSWLLETVQATNNGYKTIEGPVGGDTGFDVEDYIAKFQLDSDPSSSVYQSLRVKLGYTDQLSNATYLGLTDDDFLVTPFNRYAASANDKFLSEHKQYQATYVIDTNSNWRGEVTAYRNEFSRNWYKVQSVGGESISNVLADPLNYAAEFDYLTGTTSADDDIQIRANNRAYFSKGVQAKIGWDFGFGDTDVLLNAGIRVHEDEEDRFQHQDGYRMDDGYLVLTTAAAGGSETNRLSDASVTSYFVDTEIRAGRWIFTPGLRYEDIELTRYDFSTADPAREQGPTRVRTNSVQVFIPGAGALYRLNNEWRLLAGVHKGFNPPGPGSSAQEESSVNLEAGVRFDNDTLRFESIYFRNDYDNLVGTVTDSTGGNGDIGDQYDGGEVLVSGLELSTDYSFAVGKFELPVSLNYTWTNEAEFKSAFDSGFDPWGEVEVGDALPYIPEHQLRLGAGLVSQRFRMNLAASYVGKIRTKAGQGAYDPGTSIESRIVWDAIASWNFTENLSTYIKIDNLLDETYIASRRPSGVRPGLPRTAYVGFTFSM